MMYIINMRDEKQIEELRQSILEDNELLFKMKDASCQETCMCWGLEIPDAWLDEVDALCKELEGMNYFTYKRFRTRIQADQVKEKYGGLRFYYDVVVDPPAWICWYESLMKKFFEKIRKLNFKFITVCDNDAYDEVEVEEIPEDKYDEELKRSKYICNVEVFIDDQGKRVKKTTFHHEAQFHSEPTKFKSLHKLLKKRFLYTHLLRDIFRWEPSHEQICISSILDKFARKAIADGEKACYNKCDRCGSYVSDRTRCTTRGWIEHICK